MDANNPANTITVDDIIDVDDERMIAEMVAASAPKPKPNPPPAPPKPTTAMTAPAKHELVARWVDGDMSKKPVVAKVRVLPDGGREVVTDWRPATKEEMAKLRQSGAIIKGGTKPVGETDDESDEKKTVWWKWLLVGAAGVAVGGGAAYYAINRFGAVEDEDDE